MSDETKPLCLHWTGYPEYQKFLDSSGIKNQSRIIGS